MDALDKIPSRVKYYLLDYKDRNMNEYLEKYGYIKLRDLTIEQLLAYFNFSTSKDNKILNDCCYPKGN